MHKSNENLRIKVGAGFHAKPDDASNLIFKGAPYPRPQKYSRWFAGGDKPRPYVEKITVKPEDGQ